MHLKMSSAKMSIQTESLDSHQTAPRGEEQSDLGVKTYSRGDKVQD